jgi:4-hydroxy-tetrahydrodipicolinate synthase
VELAKRMEGDAGVSTHLSISPYYNKPSDEGIRRHFMAIADNIEGGLIIYSVPGRTAGKGILSSVANDLADHPHIIGIKEASGNLERIKETIESTTGKEFFVISGDDGLTLDIIKAGGTGVISVASNVAPKHMSDMVRYARQGEYDDAGKLNSKLEQLYSALFPKSERWNPSPNPVMCHYALREMGFDVGIPRLPLTDGEFDETDAMDNALINLGLIE